MPQPHPASPVWPPEPADASRDEASGGLAPGADSRPLFGDSRAVGFSFQWHDFNTQEALDWSPRFRPGRLELCLNLEGQATLADTRHTVALPPRARVFYLQGTPPLTATRCARQSHRFVTVEFAAEFLRKHLKREVRHLHPCVLAAMQPSARQSVVAVPEPMDFALLQVVESLQRCPVFPPAQETWFRCKALELAAQAFFHQPIPDPLCTRRQRAACERAARVRQILAERLADPPALQELGRLVGCSPFYLSRQFSETTGLTIQQFLRQARLERAAELLRDRSHNVTEAALEVGYNSLSHFTVAFREAFGCCPGLYPLKTVPATATGPGGPDTPART